MNSYSNRTKLLLIVLGLTLLTALSFFSSPSELTKSSSSITTHLSFEWEQVQPKIQRKPFQPVPRPYLLDFQKQLSKIPKADLEALTERQRLSDSKERASAWAPLQEQKNVLVPVSSLPLAQDENKKLSAVTPQRRRIWMSLSVCWSSNTKHHNKQNFPYLLATKLSTRLWKAKTNVSILLQIVFEEKDRHNRMLKSFTTDLRNSTDHIILVPTKSMNCALKSQLQRLFAFNYFNIVDPEDIVVTGDVDAFVMDSQIFDNLHEDINYQIWLYQYAFTLRTGYTFAMSFIAMRARLWQQLIKVSEPASLLMAHKTFLNTFDKEKDYAQDWDYDQMILSRLILQSGLCSLPQRNKLWELVQLQQTLPKTHRSHKLFNTRGLNDSDTCFHGLTYENCNKGSPKKVYGCKWWHFYPNDSEGDLYNKFKTIMEHS